MGTHRLAVDVEGDRPAVRRDRDVDPGPFFDRCGGSDALARRLDERRALIDTDDQRSADQDRRSRLGRVGLDPDAEGEGPAGRCRQRRTGGRDHRAGPAEARAAADHRGLIDCAGRGLGVVAVGGLVLGRRARGGVEVIDEGVVGIEGALGVDRRRRLLVPVVHVDGLGRPDRQVPDIHPDQGDPQQRVEALDVIGEGGLVVGGEEAQVRAVLLGLVEVEVAAVQADQQRGAVDRPAERRALGGGVDGDLAAEGPVLLPPARRFGGGRKQQRSRHDRRDPGPCGHSIAPCRCLSRVHQKPAFTLKTV